MKILIFQYPLLVNDIAHEWARRGHEVCFIEPNDATPSVLREVKRRGFNFVFAVNYAPVLSELCREVGLPYVSWTIDPIEESRWPREIADHDLVFCFRKRWVEHWREAGNGPVHYLPLAATSNRRWDRAAADVERSSKLLWVGSSCSTDWQRHSPEVRGWYARHQATVDAWVQNRVSHLDELGGLYDGLVDLGDLVSLTQGVPDTWRVLVDDLTAFRGRVRMLSKIPVDSLELWGDAYWRRFTRSYRGFAEHGETLTKLYNEAALTLDIPRWYQTDIVTMRVFDAMASGGVVLTFANQDVEELFCPGLHLETYASPDEFAEKAIELARDPQRQQEMRRSGSAIVDRFHRIRNRVDVIEGFLRERGWWRREGSCAGYCSEVSSAVSAASGAT